MSDSPARLRFLQVAQIVTSKRIGPLTAREAWWQKIKDWELGIPVPLGVYHSACDALKLQPHPHGERHHTKEKVA